MERVITDKAGRRLTLRKFGVLETLRLFKGLGPELSANNAYIVLASFAGSVAMIDDIPMTFPASELGVEALIERLGDDGMEAVMAETKPAAVETVVANAGN
jgi:hypothetical protein